MTVKLLAAAAASLAVTGAAIGVGVGAPATIQVRPVAVTALLPLDPPPAQGDLPTDGDISSLLTNLTNPGVGYRDKTGLVEGGISPSEGRDADHNLRDASRDGKFPLSFDASNIQPAGPNAATADVTITGPKLPAPVTQNYRFVNQGGLMISHDSATSLLQTISAS